MTPRAKRAAQSAPLVRWYTLPLDEEGRIPSGAPQCQDGDEILVRVDGEAVPCTVERHHGCRFVGPDGEHVDGDAIAHRPRSRSGPSLTEAERTTERITIRLRRGYKGRLQRLAEGDGYSVAEWIETWVELAEEESDEFGKRPPKRKAG